MNQLSREISPYLLQHAENPVNWQPWGPDALRRAREEQKPIFLSIGYSACHWCHVMAHESFEDAGVAELLNSEFVCIKVDREERPDLDQIYMEAVQAMTGQGGWPMSVFLTPQQKPFFGGTYWPREARGGMAGFIDVASAVAAAWRDRREDVLGQAEQAVQYLQRHHSPGGKTAELTAAPLEAAENGLLQAFDSRYGGFGGAPKFPHSTELKLLLARWRKSKRADVLEMVDDDARPHGRRRHLRPPWRRLPPLQRRRTVARAAFREDALRQRPAGRLLSRCLAGDRAGRLPPRRPRDADYVLRDMTDPHGGY